MDATEILLLIGITLFFVAAGVLIVLNARQK
jgi:hypothetical protein